MDLVLAGGFGGGTEFTELLAQRGITPLPNPPIQAPDWFGARTDSNPGVAPDTAPG